MHLQTGQPLLLYDRHQRLLGRLVINQIGDEWVSGRFAAEPDFAPVQHLFADFVEAVNEQLFHTVSELDQEIAALGLHLGSANGTPLPAIEDVQIADGEISFRSQPSQRAPGGPVKPQPTPGEGSHE